MAVGWPLSATISARAFLPRFGMRSTLRVGGAIMAVGALAFPWVTPTNGVWLSSAGAFLMGAGMGMLNYTALLLLQGSVDWSRRGAATASNVFSRLLGNTLGAALMGAILNLGLSAAGAGVSPDKVRELMDPGTGARAVEAGLKAALAASLHWVFVAMFVLAVLSLVAAWLMPRHEEG
jgi:fucose permease